MEYINLHFYHLSSSKYTRPTAMEGNAAKYTTGSIVSIHQEAAYQNAKA
jgi:hypothetical protein